MVEKAGRIFGLGSIFCSASVNAALQDSGLTQEELLQVHQRNEDAEAALDKADWKCSSFELERSGKTVWVITDSQEQATMLLLEGP